MKTFGLSYVIRSLNSVKLNRVIKKFCKDKNMLYREKEVFSYIWAFEENQYQQKLFGV